MHHSRERSPSRITYHSSHITHHYLVAESGVAPDDLLVMSQPSLVPAPSPHQEHAVRVELTMTGFADRRLNQLGHACDKSLELRAGIEPALSPWHGDVIPLDQRSIRDTDGARGRRGDAARFTQSPRLPVTKSPCRFFWCWRKDSNLHQTGFEPVASADWATPARLRFQIAKFELRINSALRNRKSAIPQVPSGRFELTTIQFLRLATPTSWSTRA